MTTDNNTWPSPCAICGYNGPGFHQPEIHPCAKWDSEREALLEKIKMLTGFLAEAEQKFGRYIEWHGPTCDEHDSDGIGDDCSYCKIDQGVNATMSKLKNIFVKPGQTA